MAAFHILFDAGASIITPAYISRVDDKEYLIAIFEWNSASFIIF